MTSKKPRNQTAQGIDKMRICGYTEYSKKALPAGSGPKAYVTRSNRTLWTEGRLLLFTLEEQAANANDDQAELQNLRCAHWAAPLSKKIKGQKLPLAGANRLLLWQYHSQHNTAIIKKQQKPPRRAAEKEVSP